MAQGMNRYVDADDALTRMCGNEKIYIKTLNMFLANKEFEKYEAAVSAGDLPQASGHLHTLKGVAGNLSLTALFSLSEPLIQKLKAGEPDPKMIADYRETYSQTRGAVETLIQELSC